MKALQFSILFYFLFLSSYTFSQEYTVEWGNETHTDDQFALNTIKVFGYDNDHYYISYGAKKWRKLQTFNYNHELIKTQDLEFFYEDEPVSPSYGLHGTPSGNYALFADFNKKADTKSYYSSLFENGNFSPLKLHHKIENTSNYAFWNVNSVLKRSANRQYYATVVSFSLTNKKGPDQILVKLADQNLEVVSEIQYSFPNSTENQWIINKRVMDDGRVILLVKRIRPKSEREKDEPDFDYQFFILDNGNLDVIDIDLGEDIFPINPGLFNIKDAKLHFGGFYTDKSQNSGFNGHYLMNLDLNTFEIEGKHNKFDPEIIDKLSFKLQLKRKNGLPERYRIQHIVSHNDSSFSFIAHKILAFDQGNGVTGYTSENILATRLDFDGSFIKTELVDKFFGTSTFQAAYFTAVPKEDKIYIIYNRNKGKMQNLGDLVWDTELLVLNDDGEMETREILFNSRESVSIFLPSLTFQNNNLIILGRVNRDSYQFGTLTKK